MLRHVSRTFAAVLSREDGVEAFPHSSVGGMRLPSLGMFKYIVRSIHKCDVVVSRTDQQVLSVVFERWAVRT